MILDAASRRLNAQHHPDKVLKTRRVREFFHRPVMIEVEDLALSKSDLDVINTGTGEYVHVMEGERHGYDNLTIGITYLYGAWRRIRRCTPIRARNLTSS